MQIRPATSEDSAALATIQITSYRTAYAHIFPAAYLAQFSPEEQTEDWRTLIAAATCEVVYVAQQDGNIVGYGLGRWTAAPEWEGELVALHILPAFQRQGIGRRLFAAVTRHLEAQGCRTLWVGVLAKNPARQFYLRFGGTLGGEQSFEVAGVTVVEVAYRWEQIEALAQRLGSSGG